MATTIPVITTGGKLTIGNWSAMIRSINSIRMSKTSIPAASFLTPTPAGFVSGVGTFGGRRYGVSNVAEITVDITILFNPSQEAGAQSQTPIPLHAVPQSLKIDLPNHLYEGPGVVANDMTRWQSTNVNTLEGAWIEDVDIRGPLDGVLEADVIIRVSGSLLQSTVSSS